METTLTRANVTVCSLWLTLLLTGCPKLSHFTLLLILDLICIVFCNVMTCLVCAQILYGVQSNLLQSHLIQHHSLCNNTQVGNCLTGLRTKCTGFNNNLVIAACCSGTSGVVVKRFDCIIYIYIVLIYLPICIMWACVASVFTRPTIRH